MCEEKICLRVSYNTLFSAPHQNSIQIKCLNYFRTLSGIYISSWNPKSIFYISYNSLIQINLNLRYLIKPLHRHPLSFGKKLFNTLNYKQSYANPFLALLVYVKALAFVTSNVLENISLTQINFNYFKQHTLRLDRIQTEKSLPNLRLVQAEENAKKKKNSKQTFVNTFAAIMAEHMLCSLIPWIVM